MPKHSPFPHAKRFAARMLISMAAVLLVCFGTLLPASADEVSQEKARLVAGNFLRHMVRVYGGWAGSAHPSIHAAEIVTENGETVGYNFLISPSGHVLIPAEDDLPPIKMYSETSTLSLGERMEPDENPAEASFQPKGKVMSTGKDERRWLSSPLLKAGQLSRKKQKSSKSISTERPTAEPGLDYAAPGWELFTMDEEEFEAAHDKAVEDFSPGGNTSAPLLSTAWAQGTPDSGDLYNRFTPIHASGCRTLTGCTATALAQILRYHGRPIRGRGNASYTWFDGAANRTLSRDFTQAGYDWDNMPDALLSNSTDAQKNAVSRLMADLGVAMKTDYGCLASGASTPEAVTVLKDHYRYRDSMLILNRTDYAGSDEWINVFKDEIAAGRPALLRIQESGGMGHTAVVDGWREFPSKTLHINMGWGANYNGWYVPDDFSALGYTWNNTGYQAAIIGITPPSTGNLTPMSPKGNTVLYRDRGPFTFLDETGRKFQWFHLKVESENTTVHDGWSDAADVCVSGDCAVTLPPYVIQTPGNYSWRVMGWKDTSGDGSWSSFANSTWSTPAVFTAKQPLPAVPVAPLGNLSASNNTPSLIWNKTTGPSWYNIVLKDRNGQPVEATGGPAQGWYPAGRLCDSDPVTCTLDWDLMTNNNSAPALESGSYTWTIRSWGIGFSDTVRGRFYIEGSTPKNPDILAPLPVAESGKNETSPVPYMVWEDTGADWYCYWLGSPGNSWKKSCVNSSGCTGGNCSAPLDTYLNGNYSVWAQGWKNSAGTWKPSGWSDTSFTLNVSPVRPPSNMTPNNSTMVDGFTPMLRWKTCGNASWQNVLLLTAGGVAVRNATGAWLESRKYCTDISNGTCTLSTEAFAPAGLRGGIYKWRVRGWNPSGMQEFETSNDAFFSVDPYPAAKANLIAPINGSRVMGMVTFRWNTTNAQWQHLNVVDTSNRSRLDTWFGPGDINCTGGVCPHTTSKLPPIPGGFSWRIGGWNPNNGEEVTYSDWANFSI